MDTDADKTFFTATMARLLTGQGKYADAAQIYGYLLEQSPDRADLRQALDAVRAKIPAGGEGWPAVAGLVEDWVRLILMQNMLRRLEQIRFDGDD